MGGNGFIGSPLTRQLVTAGHQVAILHRNLATSQVPSSVDHILGDRNRLSSSKPGISPGHSPPHLVIPGNFAQHLVASAKRIREELDYGEVSTEEAIRRNPRPAQETTGQK